MRKYQRKWGRKADPPRGFTLSEMLVSLVLVFIGALFILRVLIFSLDYCRKSRLRLDVQQKLQSESHWLMSRPYGADVLSRGKYSKEDDVFRITWNVSQAGPEIKRIELTVQSGHHSGKICLFKSRYLFNP